MADSEFLNLVRLLQLLNVSMHNNITFGFDNNQYNDTHIVMQYRRIENRTENE